MHSPRMERTLFRVIKEFFFKNSPVDWNGRYETPAGKARHGRPHRRLRRGGSRTARGKRVPVVEINVSFYKPSKRTFQLVSFNLLRVL
jgi:hypothetical protein